MKNRNRDGGRTRNSNNTVNVSEVPFSMIQAGEVDANAEHINALRRNVQPMYIEAFTQPPGFRLNTFVSCEKHVIIGQKGTGKTAILRNIQSKLHKDGWKTEYIIFRDTILEERELSVTPFSLVIEKEKFKSSTFYHHALKKLFICVMLRLVSESFEIVSETDHCDPLTKRAEHLVKITNNTIVEEQVSIVTASLVDDVRDVNILLESEGIPTDADIIRVLKSINDKLLAKLCQALLVSRKKVALFVDELHFSYAEEQALRDDAVLGPVSS